MAEAPPDAEQRGDREPRPTADESGHRHHVVDLERMDRAENDRGRVGGPELVHPNLAKEDA
jgi:hypothetical protein